MSSVNGINVSTTYTIKPKSKTEEKAPVHDTPQTPKAEYKQLSPEDVLGNMPNPVFIKPETKSNPTQGKNLTETTQTESTQTESKIIPISKYITTEDAKRIAGSVSQCITALFDIEDEAIIAGLSDSAAKYTAALAFNNQYM